jgi:hypothetical protein
MEKYKDNPAKFKFTNLKKVENPLSDERGRATLRTMSRSPFEDAYCEVSRHRFDVNRTAPLYFKFYYLIKKP